MKRLLWLALLPCFALAQFPRPGGSGGGGGTGSALPACGGGIATNCAVQADGSGSAAIGTVLLPNTVDVTTFGAKGDMRNFSDAQCTNGSAVLYSPAQAAFTSADVGRWVQVAQCGDSYGTGWGGQVVTYTDARHVVLSTNAGATITTPQFVYTDLVLSSYATYGGTVVSSVLTPFTPLSKGQSLTITGGTGFTIKTVTILGIDYAGNATLSGNVGTAGSAGGTGWSPIPSTIGTGNYTALQAAATAACSSPVPYELHFPPGAYYLEKSKITAGSGANGVTDIMWTGCRNLTVRGYGASIHSSGAFRRASDSDVTSYENSVSPFNIVSSDGVTIFGFELNGHTEMMTLAATVVEGKNYGLMTATCKNITIRDLDTHDWATDGMIIGLMANPQVIADRNISLFNVWTHNNGRMGMTISDVLGLYANNFKCSQIGDPFTGGYGGHNPRNCVDIEPINSDVLTGEIVFQGGQLASSDGTLLTVMPSVVTDLLVDGMIFDCSMPNSCVTNVTTSAAAQKTTIRNSTFYVHGNVAAFGCQHNQLPLLQRVDVVGNTFNMTKLLQFTCNSNDGMIKPYHLIGNHFYVSGTETPQNGSILLDHNEEVSGNTFFIAAAAKYAGAVNVVNMTSSVSVHDNIYSTDLTNAADPYAVNYTGVRWWRNERSLNPVYFAVTPDGGGGNMTFGGNLTVSAPSTPSAPTVTKTCAGTCATTYSYVVVGLVGSGNTAASAVGSTTTQASTLDSTHYNTISWNYSTGANTYNVYRTVGGSTQGKINAQPVSLNYFVDNGITGDGSTAPSSATGLGAITAQTVTGQLAATQTPSQCTGGQVPTGVDGSLNAAGCFSPSGAAPPARSTAWAMRPSPQRIRRRQSPLQPLGPGA